MPLVAARKLALCHSCLLGLLPVLVRTNVQERRMRAHSASSVHKQLAQADRKLHFACVSLLTGLRVYQQPP